MRRTPKLATYPPNQHADSRSAAVKPGRHAQHPVWHCPGGHAVPLRIECRCQNVADLLERVGTPVHRKTLPGGGWMGHGGDVGTCDVHDGDEREGRLHVGQSARERARQSREQPASTLARTFGRRGKAPVMIKRMISALRWNGGREGEAKFITDHPFLPAPLLPRHRRVQTRGTKREGRPRPSPWRWPGKSVTAAAVTVVDGRCGWHSPRDRSKSQGRHGGAR